MIKNKYKWYYKKKKVNKMDEHLAILIKKREGTYYQHEKWGGGHYNRTPRQ